MAIFSGKANVGADFLNRLRQLCKRFIVTVKPLFLICYQLSQTFLCAIGLQC